MLTAQSRDNIVPSVSMHEWVFCRIGPMPPRMPALRLEESETPSAHQFIQFFVTSGQFATRGSLRSSEK